MLVVRLVERTLVVYMRAHRIDFYSSVSRSGSRWCKREREIFTGADPGSISVLLLFLSLLRSLPLSRPVDAVAVAVAAIAGPAL